MGMFDYVKYTAPCFNCGAILTGWQTKSAKDDESLMRELPTSDVAENFYDNCDTCDAWNEYDMSSGTPRIKNQEELNPHHRLTTLPTEDKN